ncbi:MAG TPA: FecR domain-containing protein [Gemmatimonadaceae bacterium]|nr:FecR domain-containing protein [Gemmatimonadaceae bacterium]
MTDEFDWRVLDRYLAGEATPEQVAAAERWIAARPERAGFVAGMRAGRPGVAAGQSWDTDAAWRRLSERLTTSSIERAPASPRSVRGGSSGAGSWRRWRRPVAFALAASLLLAIAAILWRSGGELDGRRQLLDVATGAGERRELRLDDGTRILLGVESRLRYPSAMDRGARDVQLSGEAYFEVAHRPDRPFTVQAGNSLTRVLGTTFTVRAYPDAPAVHVVVASGRVSLRPQTGSPDDGAELSAGERGTLTRDGRTAVERSVDVEQSLAWTRGELVLDNVTLGEAARELERWYDLELRIADTALASRRVTAVFRGETPDHVLEAVALAAGARIERSGRRVTLLRPR